jgi:hypothetical protein
MDRFYEFLGSLHGHEIARDVLLDTPAYYIYRVMRDNRHKGASEPKDRIFSLFTILTRTGVRISEPDYNRDIIEISLEATTAVLRKHLSITLLQEACSGDGWPSWVPDLSNPHVFSVRRHLHEPGLEFLQQANIEISGPILRVLRSPIFERVTKTSRRFPVPPDLPRITASLLCSAKESDLAAIFQATLDHLDSLRAYLVEVKDLPKTHLSKKHWEQASVNRISEAISFVLWHRDVRNLDRPVGWDLLRAFQIDSERDSLAKPLDHRKIPSQFRPKFQALENMYGSHWGWSLLKTMLVEEKQPESTRIYSLFNTSLEYGLRFFQTESCTFEIASDFIKEDDVLVYLRWMYQPIIVRPASNATYRLISPADFEYVGDRADLINDRDAVWEWISAKDVEGEWITIS